MPEIPWTLDAELREILVCPACHGALLDFPEGLVCGACTLLYPVTENIPNMIPKEALPFPATRDP